MEGSRRQRVGREPRGRLFWKELFLPDRHREAAHSGIPLPHLLNQSKARDKKAVVWAAPWDSQLIERGEDGCGGQTETLSPGSGTLASDTSTPAEIQLPMLSMVFHRDWIRAGTQPRFSWVLKEWWKQGGLGEGERDLTIFLRGLEKQKTQEQSAVAIHWVWTADIYRTKTLLGKLELMTLKGKEKNAKDLRWRITVFLLRSLQNGLPPISFLQSWRKLRPGEFEGNWGPRVQESFPHRELESESLSCQACVSPQFRDNVISSEEERQQWLQLSTALFWWHVRR